MDEPSILLLRPSLPLAPNPRGKSQLLSPTQGHCSRNSLFSCASLSPSLLVHFHNHTEYSIYLLLKEKKILRNPLFIPPLLPAVAPISLLHVASQHHERAFYAPSPAPMITHKPTPLGCGAHHPTETALLKVTKSLHITKSSGQFCLV